jgi:H+/gluconate symporter-like permease
LHGTSLIFLTLASIALLLFLILVVKLHAFLALLLASMALGLAAGMPAPAVLKSIQTGFGEALGFIAVVVGLGAMIGRLVEQSGGGSAVANWMLGKVASAPAGPSCSLRCWWACLFSLKWDLSSWRPWPGVWRANRAGRFSILVCRSPRR